MSLTDDFKMMNELKKERHKSMFINNMLILDSTELLYIFKDTVCLFRESGKPKVDFYPHTGRWKYNNKMFKGGADKFIKWYEDLIK